MRWAHAVIICVSVAVLAGCGGEGDSLARLRAEVRHSPDSLDARLKLADAYMEMEAYHDAFIQYSAARELDSNSFGATLGLARAQEKLNNVDGALTRADQALQLKPGDPDALALKGRALLRENRVAEAADVLTDVLVADPDNEQAHRHLPIAYLRAEKLAEAEDAARAAVEALPSSVEAHMNLATVLLAREKTDEAETVLRAAVNLDPSAPLPPRRLAELLVRQGRKLDEALELAERSSDLDPGDGDAEAVAALALKEQGREEDAVRRLHTAAMAHPRNVRLWLMLASLYRDLGEDEAAARAASMAFRFAPRRRVRSIPDDGEQQPDNERPAQPDSSAAPDRQS